MEAGQGGQGQEGRAQGRGAVMEQVGQQRCMQQVWVLTQAEGKQTERDAGRTGRMVTDKE